MFIKAERTSRYVILPCLLTHTIVSLVIFGWSLPCNSAVEISDSPKQQVQVLQAPITLVYSVKIVLGGPQVSQGVPLKTGDVGQVTVSYDGTRVLYVSRFSHWEYVLIGEQSSDTEYSYDSRYRYALVQPGFLAGIVGMSFLPMPGVGYSFYPLFQDFEVTGSSLANAQMAIIGGVNSAQGNYVSSLAYQYAKIVLNSGVLDTTVKQCIVPVDGRPSLTAYKWSFAKYVKFGTVPIAGEISRTIYVPRTQGFWPPSSMKLDSVVRYSLIRSVAQALPRKEYQLESYIPANCAISDTRANP